MSYIIGVYTAIGVVSFVLLVLISFLGRKYVKVKRQKKLKDNQSFIPNEDLLNRNGVGVKFPVSYSVVRAQCQPSVLMSTHDFYQHCNERKLSSNKTLEHLQASQPSSNDSPFKSCIGKNQIHYPITTGFKWKFSSSSISNINHSSKAANPSKSLKDNFSMLNKKQFNIYNKMMSMLVDQGKVKSPKSRINHRTIPLCTNNKTYLPDINDNNEVSREDAPNLENIKQALHKFQETVSTKTFENKSGNVLYRELSQSTTNLFDTERGIDSKIGSLNLSTQHNAERQSFQLVVNRLSFISRNDNLINSCVYLQFYLDPGKHQKQESKRLHCDTNCLQVHQLFTFKNLRKQELMKQILKIKLYCRKGQKKKILQGKVDLTLSTLNFDIVEIFDVELVINSHQPPLSRAGMNITICHHAAFNKLEVFIQGVKNLPKKHSMLNSYATVSLFKEMSVEEKDTQTKRKTRHPEFNELFEFRVSTNRETPLATYSLVVTLANQNIFGKDQIFGHVIFSATSPQKEAALMWRDLSNSPDKRLLGFFPIQNPTDIWTFPQKIENKPSEK